MNVQFAVKDGEVYLIEVNPRASRTVPFVAKAIGRPVAKIAARVMAGEPLSELRRGRREPRLYRGQGIGVPVRALPRDRSGARTGNEEHRRSHGNRCGFRHRLRQGADRRGDGSCRRAGRRSCRSRTPTRTISSRRSRSWSSSASRSSRPAAPRRTCRRRGLPVETVNKVAQGRPHIVDRLLDGEVGAGVQHDRGLAVAEGQPFDPRDGARPRRCPTSRRRRRAWPRRGRSRRCAGTRLKSPRSNPIIPPPRD